MRRAVCSLPAGIRYINPLEARLVGTIIPRKPASDDTSEIQYGKEQVGSVVTFSKPPPTPSSLAPLIALVLLDAWLKRNKNDDA